MSSSVDIIWHNSQTNETQVWFREGNAIKRRATVVDENGAKIFIGPPFSIVGVSPGQIAWHNSQTNETQLWFMEGTAIKRRATVVDEKGAPIFVGPPFSIVGVGSTDIVWHNAQSNETQIWAIEGNKIHSRQTVVDEKGAPIFVGLPFSIFGVNESWFVWHNSQSNETQIWFMEGKGIEHRATVVDENGNKIFVGPPFSIVGSNAQEIVWHNSQSNETQIWFMNGGGDGIKRRATVVDENSQKIFVGPPWSIAAVSTFSVPIPFNPPPVKQPDTREFDAIDSDNGTTRLASDLALGGSARVVVTNTGAFTFTVNAHDSGFDNIDYSLVAILMTKSGLAFTFAHQGGVEGTSAGLPVGTPRRDDHATITGTNPTLKDEFARLDGALFIGTLKGTDALVNGIEGFIAEELGAALKQLSVDAVNAVVALVAA